MEGSDSWYKPRGEGHGSSIANSLNPVRPVPLECQRAATVELDGMDPGCRIR